MARRPFPLIGTAGWSLPLREQEHFPGTGSHLERYAAVFDASEINTTFHRSHRQTTFARWAASVPAAFRFSVKMPRTITHDARLAGTRALVEAFIESLRPLGPRLGCVLVQLPPKLELAPRRVRAFLDHLRDNFDGDIALEARHPSWFSPTGEKLLLDRRVARVAADPPRAPGDGAPGGWGGLAYYRLHGSPRVYYSSYGEEFLEALAERLSTLQLAGVPSWCIFDNTTLGAGTGNARALLARVRRKHLETARACRPA